MGAGSSVIVSRLRLVTSPHCFFESSPIILAAIVTGDPKDRSRRQAATVWRGLWR